jgi:hypothetical protein
MMLCGFGEISADRCPDPENRSKVRPEVAFAYSGRHKLSL